MKLNDTNRGYQAVNDDGRVIAIITAKTEAKPARPAAMGVPAAQAVAPQPLPRDQWTFEFPGRPISEVELKSMLEGLPGK